MIGRSGERGSGISVLPARHDDDDDDRGITLTTVAAKVYNVLLLNHIRPEAEKILGKNPNRFRRS